ncbi:MAG: hypothetical protein AABZ60_13990 [Planctomycetota bacterium]
MSEIARRIRLLGICILYCSLSCWGLGGCAIGRTYTGSSLPDEAHKTIVFGQTTKSEILNKLGPPQEIFPQKEGFIYLYRYTQINEVTLILQEPVFSQKVLFKYEKSAEKSDSLVVLFNKEGVVQSYGWGKETPTLPFL